MTFTVEFCQGRHVPVCFLGYSAADTLRVLKVHLEKSAWNVAEIADFVDVRVVLSLKEFVDCIEALLRGWPV